jgi:hypothetical protein
MTALAVRLAGVDGVGRVSARDVLFAGYSLEMVRIAAAAVAAKVVDFQARRDRAVGKFVSCAVSADQSVTPASAKGAVAIVANWSRPISTAGLRIGLESPLKAFAYVEARTSHLAPPRSNPQASGYEQPSRQLKGYPDDDREGHLLGLIPGRNRPFGGVRDTKRVDLEILAVAEAASVHQLGCVLSPAKVATRAERSRIGAALEVEGEGEVRGERAVVALNHTVAPAPAVSIPRAIGKFIGAVRIADTSGRGILPG